MKKVKRYEILNILPAGDLVAVFDMGDKPPSVSRIQWVGVAKVRIDDIEDGQVSRTEEAGTEVVGIELELGEPVAVNDTSNFVGLFRKSKLPANLTIEMLRDPSVQSNELTHDGSEWS